MLKKIGRQLFAFLSSLQLAVVTLILLAAVLTAGTILESLHDAETARHYVYGTVWFSFLLFILGLNVFFAALSRWPWKKHHTGFLITHLGILTVLAGAFVTLWKGYEGQVVVAEGETVRRMTLQEPQLFFFDTTTGKLETLKADFRFNPPCPAKPFFGKALGDLLVRVDDYIPNAMPELQVVDHPNGEENPALKIQLKGSRATAEEWVFSREYDQQRIQLGLAHLTFLEVPNEFALQKLLKDTINLSGPLTWTGEEWVPVIPNLHKEIPTRTGTLIIEEFFPHAVVSPEGVGNLSPRYENPAIRYSIEKNGKKYTGLAFSKYPKFNLIDAKPADADSPSLFLIPNEWGGEKNELIFARLPHGEIFYSIKNNSGWSKPVAFPKEGISPGWMDFHLTLLQNFQFAERKNQYRKVQLPKQQGKDGPPPAIQISLGRSGISQTIWLGRGEAKDITLGGRDYKVAYGLKSIPLGMELTLNDFKMTFNEGTNSPATFASDITLVDPRKIERTPYHIAMNQPLKYGRYKFFQASYQQGGPNSPDISVLAVAYDPGVPIKYLGSLIMVIGIATMFFLKPLFLQKRKRIEHAKNPLNADSPSTRPLKVREELI